MKRATASSGETGEQLQSRAKRICATLKRTYPHVKTALTFKNPFELLIATILSAQCTDTKVNEVTPTLFSPYPNARALAAADSARVEEIIHSTGFFRQKAKSIRQCARALAERLAGRVPESMEELTALPGVGRKTANVVRAFAMGHPGLIVDTHFKRVIGRLGLSARTDPDKIEADLAQLLPAADWTSFSSALIAHGRRICQARKPLCTQCPVRGDCVFGHKMKE